MKTKSQQANELARLVIEWWEKHQFDSVPGYDGDEYNAYDEEPDFVTAAKKYLEDDTP